MKNSVMAKLALFSILLLCLIGCEKKVYDIKEIIDVSPELHKACWTTCNGYYTYWDSSRYLCQCHNINSNLKTFITILEIEELRKINTLLATNNKKAYVTLVAPTKEEVALAKEAIAIKDKPSKNNKSFFYGLSRGDIIGFGTVLVAIMSVLTLFGAIYINGDYLPRRCSKLCEGPCTGKCKKRLWLHILKAYTPIVILLTLAATFIGICINWNLFYVWGIAAGFIFLPVLVGLIGVLCYTGSRKGVNIVFSMNNKFFERIESFLDNMESKESK